MNTDGDSPFSQANAFVKMWADFASSMTKAGMMFSPDSSSPEVARQMRTSMLTAWADYCDRFMRSSEFLDMMKQSLSASVQVRRQFSEFFGQLQHEFQGASRQDVDQLMLSLRHIERRLVDGMERLSTRLDELDARLQTFEKQLAKQPAARPAKRTKAKTEDE